MWVKHAGVREDQVVREDVSLLLWKSCLRTI